MRLLSPVERKAVLEFVNDNSRVYHFVSQTRIPSQFPLQPLPPSAEKLNLMNSMMYVCESSEVSEIQRCQNYSVVPGSCKTILGWWKEHAQEFPQLAHIAKTILCIMATSAPSEKSFSVAGHVSERRSCLSGSSVSDVLLINSAPK